MQIFHITLDKIKKLMDTSLIRTSKGERTQAFVITEDGIKFYRELINFKELIGMFRVRASKVMINW